MARRWKRFGPRYAISRIVPVPMRNRYDGHTVRWWQWRGHMFLTRG